MEEDLKWPIATSLLATMNSVPEAKAIGRHSMGPGPTKGHHTEAQPAPKSDDSRKTPTEHETR